MFSDLTILARIKTPDVGIPLFLTESEVTAAEQSSSAAE